MCQAGAFETLERTFRWLITGPRPLLVHPHRCPDLPSRPLPLDQLRALLESATVGPITRAGVWSYLVRQARTPGPRQPAWTVATAAMALPDLVRIVRITRAHNGPRARPADLEAAALGAFLAELRRVDLDTTRDPRLRRLLLLSAYRAARTLNDTTPAGAAIAATESARSARAARQARRAAIRRGDHTPIRPDGHATRAGRTPGRRASDPEAGQ